MAAGYPAVLAGTAPHGRKKRRKTIAASAGLAAADPDGLAATASGVAAAYSAGLAAADLAATASAGLAAANLAGLAAGGLSLTVPQTSSLTGRLAFKLLSHQQLSRDVVDNEFVNAYICEDFAGGSVGWFHGRRRSDYEPVLIKRFHEVAWTAPLKEILFLDSLKHPNILPVLDAFGHHRGPRFVFRNPGHGRPLLECSAHHTRKTWAEHVAITKGALQALAYLASKDMVHCNVRPDNIWVSPGQVFLADFGRATLSVDGARTTFDISYGCPTYHAPELLLGETRITHEADVWSMAVVFMVVVLGQPVWKEDTTLRVMRCIVKAIGKPTITEVCVLQTYPGWQAAWNEVENGVPAWQGEMARRGGDDSLALCLLMLRWTPSRW